MFRYFEELLRNPVATFTMLALALPGRLLAISAHECAHAWVASRCGDDTARMLGRVTLNPLKHLDLVGTLMMVFVGFGWAKPVPVNPRNFRNYRRDDLLVSIAGVTTNFILFVVSLLLMYAILGFTLAQVADAGRGSAVYMERYFGQQAIMMRSAEGTSYMYVSDALRYAPYMSEFLITPMFGSMAGNAYTALMYFTITNLVLAIFNLVPIPPLDGYHVINDLFLRRPLFASPRAMQASSGILLLLMFTGYLSEAIGYVQNAVLTTAGNLALQVFSAIGIL